MQPPDDETREVVAAGPTLLLQAALNGDRVHPALPRTPGELAAEARAAVEAGAWSLHLHPYDDKGQQTLAAAPCAAALHAVRAACPGIPISLSTSAGIEPDPERRYALVATWTNLPDLVTVNQGEEGILQLCELRVTRGVGLEAGLLSLDDARAFVAAGSHRAACVRWWSRWMPTQTMRSRTQQPSSKCLPRAEYSSNRSTMAMA